MESALIIIGGAIAFFIAVYFYSNVFKQKRIAKR